MQHLWSPNSGFSHFILSCPAARHGARSLTSFSVYGVWFKPLVIVRILGFFGLLPYPALNITTTYHLVHLISVVSKCNKINMAEKPPKLMFKSAEATESISPEAHFIFVVNAMHDATAIIVSALKVVRSSCLHALKSMAIA